MANDSYTEDDYRPLRIYYRGDDGPLSIGSMTRYDIDQCQTPDGERVTLQGWPDAECESYNGGNLLVPVEPTYTDWD